MQADLLVSLHDIHIQIILRKKMGMTMQAPYDAKASWRQDTYGIQQTYRGSSHLHALSERISNTIPLEIRIVNGSLHEISLYRSKLSHDKGAAT